LDLERWKSQQISIVRGDLVLKHRMMADAVFPFMRSTFYRWAQLWPIVYPELARGPQVLVVGDLHVDNFCTWRDLEGRLVWGVNDFDEAWLAAYASDLVRLLVSAYYAIGEEKLVVPRAKRLKLATAMPWIRAAGRTCWRNVMFGCGRLH
jgi:uncharacterized protein (DUF2252 family)